MHDETSKYSSELNGIYIRYLGAENSPCSFPYALKNVKGDLIAYWVESHLVDETGDMLEVQGSALVSEVSNYEKDKIFPVPSNYFKLGKLK